MSNFITEPFCIAICDDEPDDCQSIARLTREILKDEGIRCAVLKYYNGKDLLNNISVGIEFAILMLDVLMEELDGMELAARLREQGDHTAIIFFSNNREMALRGYEVEAARYLAKPLNKEKLREALLYCCRTQAGHKELLLPTHRGQVRIRPSDLIYAETWNRGVMLHMRNDKRECSMKISELASMLTEQQFVFCHRTILVNLAYARSIRRCELELESGEVLPISKYRQQEVKRRLMRYLDA